MTVTALRETPRRPTETQPRTDGPAGRPEPPFECGHSGEAVWYEPEQWSAEWEFDPVPQWQCPACGRCLGSPEIAYAGVGGFSDDDWERIRSGRPLTRETRAALRAARH